MLAYDPGSVRNADRRRGPAPLTLPKAVANPSTQGLGAMFYAIDSQAFPSLTVSLAYGESVTREIIIYNNSEETLDYELWLSTTDTDEVYFERPDNVDWSQEQNQDRIADNVWLTRPNNSWLFNAAVETGHNFNDSPELTEWAGGSTYDQDYGNQYKVWGSAVYDKNNNGPISLPGDTYSLYLPGEDLFYDVEYITWTDDGSGNGGGGFSWTRYPMIGDYQWAINLSERRLSVAPGQTDTLTITFNPQGTFSGDYELPLQFWVYYPGTDTWEWEDIPLSLTVESPLSATEIADKSNAAGFGSEYISVSSVFTHAGGSSYSISASSSDTSVVDVVIVESTILSVTEKGEGTSVITLTAYDDAGNSASTTFNYTVSSYSYTYGDEADTVDLSALFSGISVDSYMVTVGDTDVAQAQVSGSDLILSFVGAGSTQVDVAAVDTGGDTTNTSLTVLVAKASQTITVTTLDLYGIVYGDGSVTIEASASSGLDLTYTSGDTTVVVMDGNVATFVGSGQSSILITQAGDDNYEEAPYNGLNVYVAPAELTVTAQDTIFTYGTDVSNMTYSLSYSGFVNGEDASDLLTQPYVSTEASGVLNVGTNSLSPGGGESYNYSFNYVDGTLTIEPVALTVVADSVRKDEGEEDPELTYTLTAGAMVGEDSLSGALTRESGEAAGTYAITQGTLAAPSENYSLTFVEGLFTITTPICTEAKPAGLVAEQGSLSGVGTDWVSVSFTQPFYDAIVVATPVLDTATDSPAVTRIKDITTCGFKVKVQGAGGADPVNRTVHWMAVEEGVYTEAEHGATLEARKYAGTTTATSSNWQVEEVGYQQTYQSPVVLGQVMSYNDPLWSVFYAQGATRISPPDSSGLYVGKHVGADPVTTRAEEMLGIIVLESGSGTLGDAVRYSAGVGADIVEGPDNNADGYAYQHALTSATGAVVSAAAMDGGDGGWPVVHGVSGTELSLYFDEDQLGDSERQHTTEQVAYVVLAEANPSSDLVMERGTLYGVDSTWMTVSFTETYFSPVVVATPVLPDVNTAPMVTRVRNVSSTGFEVRVQGAGGGEHSNVTVHWVAVEEGTYTEAKHGIAMEAKTFLSSTTASNANGWTQEPQSYHQAYTTPVVLGQVMSEQDENWSVFWSSDYSRTSPASALEIAAGKQVSSDPSDARADEVVGMIVMESGTYTLNGLTFSAGLSADFVKGVNGSTGDGYAIAHTLSRADVAVVSGAGMDGGDGGWPVLFGSGLQVDQLTVVFDEDQAGDTERTHTDEQVAYFIIGEEQVPFHMERGEQGLVTTDWMTVTFAEPFTSAVVVATPLLPNETIDPIVTRVRNVTEDSFEMRVQSAGGTLSQGVTVYWVAVEEGVYTVAQDSIALEAHRVSSAATANRNNWAMEARTYAQPYSNPVVLGQVMSQNDSDWSVFWSASSFRTSPADSSGITAGLHVGEDTDTDRASETIGYIVLEAGSGSIQGLDYEAGVGSDILRAAENDPAGYSYTHSLASADAAIVSAAGMDGGDGGWPVLYAGGVSSTDLTLIFDEDISGDSERAHTTEQAAYWIFSGDAPADRPEVEVAPVAEVITLTNDSFTVYPNPTEGPFTLRVESGAEMPQLVARMVDLSGRTWELTPQYTAAQSVSYDVSTLPSGLYVLLLHTEAGQFSQRVMVK